MVGILHVNVGLKQKEEDSNQFPCNGECGKKNCGRVCGSESDLKRHISKEKFQCPLCNSSPFSHKRKIFTYILERNIRMNYPKMDRVKNMVLLLVLLHVYSFLKNTKKKSMKQYTTCFLKKVVDMLI